MYKKLINTMLEQLAKFKRLTRRYWDALMYWQDETQSSALRLDEVAISFWSKVVTRVLQRLGILLEQMTATLDFLTALNLVHTIFSGVTNSDELLLYHRVIRDSRRLGLKQALIGLPY